MVMSIVRNEKVMQVSSFQEVVPGDLVQSKDYGIVRYLGTVSDGRDDMFVSQEGNVFNQIYSPRFMNRVESRLLVLDQECPQVFPHLPGSWNYDQVKALAEGTA